MFLTNSESFNEAENLAPIWEETGLEYNFKAENKREKVIDVNVAEVRL